MTRLMSLALLGTLISTLSAAPLAAAPVADEGIFVEGSRYDAVFNGTMNRWRLLPAQGREMRLRVADTCRHGSPPPPGLWLLSRDADDRPVLVAPSATALPAGHPGRVRLLPCDQARADALPVLAVPESIIEWLSTHSGAVYVPR
ncbi:MAG TPA: hypothetical protein VFY00_02660 [Arenimonas sp.]|nr:hypothetical protein [Arenimonas sp.]